MSSDLPIRFAWTSPTEDSFNPLVIGACLRTNGRKRPTMRARDEVSIPSSSGHVFGHRMARAIRRTATGFQSPRHRGMSSDIRLMPSCTALTLMFQSPRHRGMSSDWRVRRHYPRDRKTFQSPRHRGMSSDSSRYRTGPADQPGFNPLVIGACLRTSSRSANASQANRPCFNPLVIGACLRTRRHRRTARHPESHVSIPSSSGHVFGHDRLSGASGSLGRGFNPLVIGACLRTLWGIVAERAICSRFQSPRHRGMSSDAGDCRHWQDVHALVSIPSSSGHVFGPVGVSLRQARGWSFNPLVIGACLRTGRNAWSLMSTRPQVSIPSSSGHVFGLRTCGSASCERSPGFNPLVIGACLRTMV